MASVAFGLFWGSLAILLYVYAGYVLCLTILALFIHPRHAIDENARPRITILFSARNERASLPGKLESIRKLHYPKDHIQVFIASDASTDGTNEYLQKQSDITCFLLDQHAGKNAALNTMLPHATGDIVFFTDANTLFHPDCLRHIAKHFADPTVGCVTGNLVFTHEKDWNPVGQGTGFYWQYENRIKQLENRLGSVLVGGGSLLTTRRELIHELIPTIANDLEIPIRLGANGYRVLYEKECLGFEKPHTHVIEEFNRTSRIVSRGLRGFVTLFPTLLKSPFRFWQFVSHKFLRWFTLPLALCALLSAFLLRQDPLYASVFFGGCLLIGIIALGFAAMLGGFNAKVLKIPKVLAHFLIMQTGACWGLFLALSGQTPSTWTIPGSSRQ